MKLSDSKQIYINCNCDSGVQRHQSKVGFKSAIGWVINYDVIEEFLDSHTGCDSHGVNLTFRDEFNCKGFI